MTRILKILKDISRVLILLSTVSDQLEGLKAEIEILEQEITRLDASLEEISRVVIASHVT